MPGGRGVAPKGWCKPEYQFSLSTCSGKGRLCWGVQRWLCSPACQPAGAGAALSRPPPAGP